MQKKISISGRSLTSTAHRDMDRLAKDVREKAAARAAAAAAAASAVVIAPIVEQEAEQDTKKDAKAGKGKKK